MATNRQLKRAAVLEQKKADARKAKAMLRGFRVKVAEAASRQLNTDVSAHDVKIGQSTDGALVAHYVNPETGLLTVFNLTEGGV
ncbi:hypothetical protein [Roseinatronobacter sp.]|uniref:hypothetical protein n=1 Tax=Roseinatronobacter sp. TaxID=1945755 RepID=UPI0025DF838D|nr:hypothetical protein [Roseibaca sp.]